MVVWRAKTLRVVCGVRVVRSVCVVYVAYICPIRTAPYFIPSLVYVHAVLAHGRLHSAGSAAHALHHQCAANLRHRKPAVHHGPCCCDSDELW